MIEGADLELFERSIRHANEAHTGAELDQALHELGWADALAFDPHAAVSIHFEHQGRAGTTSSALERVIAAALGVEATAVVLPALGRSEPPAVLAGGKLVVDGLLRAAGGEVVVVASDGGKAVAAAVAAGDLVVTPVRGIDAALGLALVRGEVAAPELAPVDWPAAVDLARIALAHELVGMSRTMLDLARTHALERIQFGQPIAGFQAVRHRLAETLVAVESAQAVLDAAWIDRSPVTAAMAKAVAGRSARTAAKHCQQVLAGIGFTTEHPFHLHLKRMLVLEELFGSARTLGRALGEEVLATGQLPPMLAL